MGLDSCCVLSSDVRQLWLPHTMTWNHRKRFAMVLFALVNLLFMQLAVAAYACPGGLSKAGGDQIAAMAQAAGMPCVESMASAMDDEQPSLCHAHSKAEQQTADKHQVPGLASLADLASDFPLPRATPAPLGTLLQAPLLRRTTAPSLAVRHCCFRL